MDRYDVAVIGGGPGGYIAAIRAAQLGGNTVLVERQDVGGTCLNRGCIPTKTLLHSAEVYEQMLHAKALGLTAGECAYQYKKLSRRKDKVVKTLRSGVENLLSGHGVKRINGRATLTGSHTFLVEGQRYEADRIILATGSSPARIPIPGTDWTGVLTSDDVLSLEECPESLVIVGGGVIGVEFATLFAGLGKQVTILELFPTILYGNDPDICISMERLLKDKGVEIHTSTKVVGIDEGPVCRYEENGEEKTVAAQAIILATGRRPNTSELGLEAAGVATHQGFVAVDEHMRTNIPHIYAIGDITGKQQLAHVASAQGIVAAHNAAGQERVIEYSAVPGCIYTNPEIATVGLTETVALEMGLDVTTGRFAVSGNGRSMAIGCQDGFAKLVVEQDTHRIVGCHIMAPHATEMIGEAVLAIRKGMTAEDLADTIHPHPTVSEVIMEAAHDVDGLCCHKL